MITADTHLVTALYPSPNFGERRGVARPDILLLHYTGMQSCERAIWWLANPQANVSCHYVVDCDGRITQMVAEADRAWHAGAGTWQGYTDINSRSIGIEIHNPGHDMGYPEFPEAQMQAVVAIGRDIVTRHGIPAAHVLAHSDIAPSRKIDPGEKFDWQRLAAAGVGHWVAPVPVDPFDEGLGLGASDRLVAGTQLQLAVYGYGIATSGILDAASMTVLRAFQRRFRPARIDGRLDRSTGETLARVVGGAAAG